MLELTLEDEDAIAATVRQPAPVDLLLALAESADVDVETVLRSAGAKSRKLADACRDKRQSLPVLAA